MTDPKRRPRGTVGVRHFAGHLAHHEHFDAPIRVAHLTDQHVGRVTPMATQREAIDRINEERPHLVALTGDFVGHGLGYLDQLRELIESIEAPTIAVMGNHDHWSGPDEVRRTLRRAGAEILDNAWTTFTVDGVELQVVGVDDAYTGHADAESATRGLDRTRPTLGLSHVPEVADALWQRGVELVLAGHTHAGQLTFRGDPHRFNLAAMAGHRYVHGLYGDRRGEGALYVSAGIGAAVMPFRFGERGRSEVAVFDLGAEPGTLHETHSEQQPLPGRAPSPELTRKRQEAARARATRRRPKAHHGGAADAE